MPPIQTILRFRQACSTDLPALTALRYWLTSGDSPDPDIPHQTTFSPPCRRRLVELDSSQDITHWVVERNGELIAMLSVVRVQKRAGPEKPDSCWAYLTNIYTLPRFRQQGIYRALRDQARKWALSHQLELQGSATDTHSVPFSHGIALARHDDPMDILPD
jgi:GNAT superfamily N-acetyltransferase